MEKEIKKYLFLDVDWVLAPLTNYPQDFILKWRCVNELKRIIETTNSKVVISSSWRLNDSFLNILYNECKFFWLNLEKYVVWKTPQLTQWRWAEIRQWITNNGYGKFVILEDDPFDMHFYNEQWKVVHTKSDIWLTKEDADKAISILEK